MTKKLDKEHSEAITELQSKFAQNANVLGNIAIEEHVTVRRLESIKQDNDKYLEIHESLVTEEQNMIQLLKDHYGEGTINIQDGTFTTAE